MLQKKVDYLLPDKNFYFVDLKQKETIRLEGEEVVRFITDSCSRSRHYVTDGMVSPVYLDSKVRDLLVEAMDESLQSCSDEIAKSNKMHEEKTGDKSEDLDNVYKQLKSIQDEFEKGKEKKWTFKKVDQKAI